MNSSSANPVNGLQSNSLPSPPPGKDLPVEALQSKKRADTFSAAESKLNANKPSAPLPLGETRRRKNSEDVNLSYRKLHVDVETVLTALQSLDEDGDGNISADDFRLLGHTGFSIQLPTINSHLTKSVVISSHHQLSQLLEYCTIAKRKHLHSFEISQAQLTGHPLERMENRIPDVYWMNLTRRLDEDNIEKAADDKKDPTPNARRRIYVPEDEPRQREYWEKVAMRRPVLNLDVQTLRKGPFDGKYVQSLNDKFGILALEMEELPAADGGTKWQGLPFVVPGGRFNELYGWDSYFTSLGLLISGRIDIVKGIVRNFCFCIKHYGKILNANRSYYLCRSQPPFLTDLVLRLYHSMPKDEEAKELLQYGILAAIKEYNSVWMTGNRFDKESGLSRYAPDGAGVPPETEPSHFEAIIAEHNKEEIPFEEFVEKYNSGEIKSPELDEYFRHDRAVRESGHDTTMRLDNKCADLATVDLNSLLYKYEVDVARSIRYFFNDKLLIPDDLLSEGQVSGHVETSSSWDRKAKRRRILIERLLWNEEAGMYFDYNTRTRKQETFVCATTLWPLWAGLCDPQTAARLVASAIPKLECWGGLAGSDEASVRRETLHIKNPNRQWDYPYGWAPHQMMAWIGLMRYGDTKTAHRLAYRWILMVVKQFADFSGAVVEKYNVTDSSHAHKVDAEYGNQGADFKGFAEEGFGWCNASVLFGLSQIDFTTRDRRCLNVLADWDAQDKTEADGLLNQALYIHPLLKEKA